MESNTDELSYFQFLLKNVAIFKAGQISDNKISN